MSERTKYQRGEPRVVRRSQINPAPYNPRFMGAEAQKRLRKKIRESGLLGALIWNEQTGNLVAGHQRLEQLDKLEGYPKRRKDYELIVWAVDLSEKEEKEFNVFLNNPSAQGDWDLDKLAELCQAPEVDIDSMGFSPADIEILFDGDSRLAGLFNDAEEVKETKEKLREIKRARKDGDERMKADPQADAEYYFVVVCESGEEKQSILRRLGVPAREEFVYSDVLLRNLDRE